MRRAPWLLAVLLTGCECGPLPTTPPGGPLLFASGTSQGDGGARDGGRGDAGQLDAGAGHAGADAGLDAGPDGNCWCSSGGGALACGESRCEGGLRLECRDAGLLTETVSCGDAGRPAECSDETCTCDIPYGSGFTFRLHCCETLCTSDGVGRTCHVGGRVETGVCP